MYYEFCSFEKCPLLSFIKIDYYNIEYILNPRVILILGESLVPGARYTLDWQNPLADKQYKHALDSSSSVAAALPGVH